MNKVVLTGRLTKNPELRYTANNKPVCEFTIATNRIGNDNTDFINCVVWNNQAENTTKYMEKGSLIAVFGELRTETYEIEGNKKYKTYVLGNNIEFLESKSASKNDPMKLDGSKDIKIEDSDLPW
jgi:single-strand DNA-binding protein